MLFNSFAFAVFFSVVLCLYYLVPQVYRWILILVSSGVFYAYYKLSFLYIILLIIIIDYLCALAIEHSEKIYWRKFFLAVSLVSNLGILFFYKYIDFILTSLSAISFLKVDYQSASLGILLPVGLSFHTFQSLGYTIDVSKKKIKAERHLGYFASFVLFFPQMVAGPIEEYASLGNQLKEKKVYSYDALRDGFRLVLYGFFVKVVVADSISIPVDEFYKSPENFNSYSTWLAVLLFSVQIYADFLGYSTMAVGLAKCLGITMMDNFKSPYLAWNMVEFWRRWHISLTSWFRKYVYLPLGGNRVSMVRWVLNILLVFSLSGLWHGASWNFIWWGIAHGLVYLLEMPLDRARPTNRFLMIGLILVNFIVVSLLWVFFRADDMPTIIHVFEKIILFLPEGQQLTIHPKIPIVVVLFFVMEIISLQAGIGAFFSRQKLYVRWSWYVLLIFVVFLFSEIKTQPFIYFQF